MMYSTFIVLLEEVMACPIIDTVRQTDRQTDRQAGRQTDRQGQGQGHSHRQPQIQTERKADLVRFQHLNAHICAAITHRPTLHTHTLLSLV